MFLQLIQLHHEIRKACYLKVIENRESISTLKGLLMWTRFMRIILLLVLLSVSAAFGQTWQSSVVMPKDPKQVQLYNIVINAFRNYLAEKIYGGEPVNPDIIPQSFEIRGASLYDEPTRCPHPNTEKAYIASLSWRWLMSPLNKVDLYVCVSTDPAENDRLAPIPGTRKYMPLETEKFYKVDPSNGGHLFRTVNEGDVFDHFPLKACLPEGYVVHGWTSATEINPIPPGVSKIQEDTQKFVEPNCVVVLVHLEGIKGGGSIGIDLSLWGSTVDNVTAEKVSGNLKHY